MLSPTITPSVTPNPLFSPHPPACPSSPVENTDSKDRRAKGPVDRPPRMPRAVGSPGEIKTRIRSMTMQSLQPFLIEKVVMEKTPLKKNEMEGALNLRDIGDSAVTLASPSLHQASYSPHTPSNEPPYSGTGSVLSAMRRVRARAVSLTEVDSPKMLSVMKEVVTMEYAPMMEEESGSMESNDPGYLTGQDVPEEVSSPLKRAVLDASKHNRERVTRAFKESNGWEKKALIRPGLETMEVKNSDLVWGRLTARVHASLDSVVTILKEKLALVEGSQGARKVVRRLNEDMALVWKGVSYRIVKDRDYVVAESHTTCHGGHLFDFVSVQHPDYPKDKYAKRYVRGLVHSGGILVEVDGPDRTRITWLSAVDLSGSLPFMMRQAAVLQSAESLVRLKSLSEQEEERQKARAHEDLWEKELGGAD